MIELLAAATLSLPWPSVTCADDQRLQNGRYAAVYSPEHKTIVLSLNVCSNLAKLQGSGKTIYFEEAHSLFTIAHELAHAAGISDEHEADCRASLIWPNVARKIRIPAVKIRALRTIMPRLDFPKLMHGTSC